MSKTYDKKNGRYMSPPCQVTYQGLNKPNEKGQYNLTVRVPKSAKERLGVFSHCYKECLLEKFPPKTKLPKGDLPIKDGDDSGKDKYVEHFYMNVKTSYEVQAVGPDKKAIHVSEIENGDTIAFKFNAYTWDYNGKKGISFGLGNIILLEKGNDADKAVLGGGGSSNPEDDFGDFDTSAYDQAIKPKASDQNNGGFDDEDFEDDDLGLGI